MLRRSAFVTFLVLALGGCDSVRMLSVSRQVSPMPTPACMARVFRGDSSIVRVVRRDSLVFELQFRPRRLPRAQIGAGTADTLVASFIWLGTDKTFTVSERAQMTLLGGEALERVRSGCASAAAGSA
jgi:hypothetical protein